MSKSKIIASVVVAMGIASPALAQTPKNPVAANPPGKQMQDAYPTPSDRGLNRGASGFVPTSPPGQATRLLTPGASFNAPGKVK